MKKLLLGSMVVVVLLGMSGVVVSAQEPESDGKVAIGVGARIKSLFGIQNEERKAEVKVQVDAKKQEVEAKKEERELEKTEKKEEKKEDKAAKQKERIMDFWNKTEKRLQTLINNQIRLADRIDKKLSNLEKNGKDVAALKVKMTAARTSIKASQDALNGGDAVVAVAVNGDSKAALEKIRNLTKNILEKIKVSHASLVDVMNSMRNVKNLPTPTPTASATPSPSATVLPSPTVSATVSPSVTVLP